MDNKKQATGKDQGSKQQAQSQHGEELKKDNSQRQQAKPDSGTTSSNPAKSTMPKDKNERG